MPEGFARIPRPMMPGLALVVAVVVALTLGGWPNIIPRAAALQPGLVYTQAPCAPVSTAPSASAPLITQLLGGTDVTLVSMASGWGHVRIWGGTDGYIPTHALSATPPARALEGNCSFPGVPDPQVDILPHDSGPFPLTASGVTNDPVTLYAWPSRNAEPLTGLAANATVRINQWAGDEGGQPWYHVTASAGSGWIWAGDIRIAQPNPATHTVHGKPVWAAAAGKGMWFTNYFTRHTNVAKLVAAAKAAGLTHLYAEVAITRYGFYAPVSLDRLLPAAHAQGIAVIAWVYPTLANVTDDIRMSVRVAQYVTPTGDRPDGLASDIEEVTDSGSVYAYGQLLRALLGPDELLVNSAMHPFTHAGYPYAAIAASWNVMAPMDYWHSRASHTYTAAEVARFVTISVVTIRAAMLADGVSSPIPIEELGQTYDMYSDDGAGTAHNPSGDEITADLQAARSLGCIGVSYFEWQTATQAQWQALSAFTWPV
jgi:hypothetical protein